MKRSERLAAVDHGAEYGNVRLLLSIAWEKLARVTPQGKITTEDIFFAMEHITAARRLIDKERMV